MAVGLAIAYANLQFSLFIRENNLRQCFRENETKALTNPSCDSDSCINLER